MGNHTTLSVTSESGDRRADRRNLELDQEETEKMVRACAFPNCGNKMKKYLCLSFHRLPLRNRKILPLWLVALQLDVQTPVRTLRERDYRVCSEHFDEDDFTEKSVSCRHLKANAIPKSKMPVAVKLEDTDYKISEMCIIQGCDRTLELLCFPKDPHVLQQWMDCLSGRLKHPVNLSSTVCSTHFTADSFINWQQKQAGLAASLMLKADALPSIFTDVSEDMYTWPFRSQNVGHHCGDPEQASVGTPLSKGAPVDTQSKEPKRISSLMLDSLNQNSPSPGAVPLNSAEELNHADEVIVKLECLLELFEKCMVCTGECSISTERDGWFFYVTQKCHYCPYTRNWASHPTDQIIRDPADNQEVAEEPWLSEDMGIHTEEEMIQEEVEEEEEEEEVEKLNPKKKRKDSDEEWAPNPQEFVETSDEESVSEDGDDCPLQVVWCHDCGDESNTSCIRQNHLQLYCCVQCGYREGYEEPACTEDQQPIGICSPEASSACNKEITCDVTQEAESSCTQKADRNDEQSDSSDCLKDSDSIKSQSHTFASGNQNATSSNQESASNEDLNNISNQGVTNCSKLHENRNTDPNATCSGVREPTVDSIPSNPSVYSSAEQGSMSSSDQEGNRNEIQEDTSSSNQDRNKSSNTYHQEASAVHQKILNVPIYASYFSDLCSLQSHIKQSHGNKRVLCPDCGKFIVMRSSRCSHVCDHKVKPFSCFTCGKYFISKSGLQRHTKIHTEEHVVHCRYCYKTFRFQEDKLKHEEMHQEEKMKYRCPDCPKRFTNFHSRSKHRKTHWKRGKVFCKVCDKGFSKSHHLKRHELVHTGLKPYMCKLCDRSFNQRGHLKAHMRVHTGEKPFKCQDCGQCFNHNITLKNHIQCKHTPRAEEWTGDEDENVE